MNQIDELVEAARMRGVRPWLAIKERLAECAIEVMAVERRTVLQGGAALHFAYHSPRLSADVDFVGSTAHAALAERGEELAARASVLPASDAASIAVGDIVSAAADWLGRYRDVL